MTWLRWETAAPQSDVVGHLAEALGVELCTAFGLYAACCLGFGEHQKTGNATCISDRTIEQWALWSGTPGAFATAFRARCLDENGVIRGWWRQAKLIARQADSAAHRTGKKPAKNRQKPARKSADNDTIRNDTIHSKEQTVSDGFDAAWTAYPRRPGDSKLRARAAYAARLKEGADPAAILTGVRQYAAYVQRERTEAQFVKMAATFFGPLRHWENDYAPPKDRTPTDAPLASYHRRYIRLEDRLEPDTVTERDGPEAA